MPHPNKPHASILLVEHQPAVARRLSRALESHGRQVLVAHNGADARLALLRLPIGLVVLDLAVSDVDGLVLYAHLKSIRDVPIILCGGSRSTHDATLGLRLGAADFVRKPVAVHELEVRVERALQGVALERAQVPSPTAPRHAGAEVLELGSLQIEQGRRRVTLDGTLVGLTPTEYRLLVALARRADEVVAYEDLAREVWQVPELIPVRMVRLHVQRLRQKLVRTGQCPPRLAAVPGFGYCLSADDRQAADASVQVARAPARRGYPPIRLRENAGGV